MHPKHYRIIIIGAGMAGLGAASKLSDLGETNFKILEGKNRPGGRINTILVNDLPLDLGAQWLHGTDNTLYDICTKHNLLSSEMSEEGLGIFVRNDGLVLDNQLAKQVDLKIGQILEQCQSFVSSTEHPNTLEEYLESEFTSYLDKCCDSEEVRRMKLELFDWHLRFQVIDNSCNSLKDLSAKSWGEYVCLDDTAHYNLKGGYKSLIDVIVNDLPEGCISLNTRVDKTEVAKNNGSILVDCNGSEKYSCDHLIVTVSLGVLKNCPNMFPTFPETISNSIRDMGFGAVSKIFLFFDKKWWGDAKGFQLIFKRDLNFEAGEKWIRHLQGFDEVFDQPNALLGWVGGEGVRQVEDMEAEEVGRLCVRTLRTFLAGFDVPEVRKCIRTRWLSDPHVLGGYCHISPACDSGETGIRQMADPVVYNDVPRIFLAGEAVHPSRYSTTDGAYESGQSQAEKLVAFLKNG